MANYLIIAASSGIGQASSRLLNVRRATRISDKPGTRQNRAGCSS